MAWRDLPIMDQRREFVQPSSPEDVNIPRLSTRLGMNRQTGYVSLKRRRAGEAADDRSRQPHSSPG